MAFYIVNEKQQPLSCFERNNLTTDNQLKFRTKDCILFSSRQEAQSHLDYINAICRQQMQARKLSISDSCKW